MEALLYCRLPTYQWLTVKGVHPDYHLLVMNTSQHQLKMWGSQNNLTNQASKVHLSGDQGPNPALEPPSRNAMHELSQTRPIASVGIMCCVFLGLASHVAASYLVCADQRSHCNK